MNTKAHSNGTTKLTREEYEEYLTDKASVLRRFAEVVKVADNKTTLLRMAEVAECEKTALSKLAESNVDDASQADVEHDAAQFAKLTLLTSGPTRAQRILWKVDPLTQKLLVWLEFALKILACITATGSLLYFGAYCWAFGLGVEWVWGTVFLAIINLITYCALFDDKETDKSRNYSLAVTTLLTITFMTFSERGYVMTPMSGVTDNLGVLLDTRTHKIKRLIYPNRSLLLAKGQSGNWLMEPPAFSRDCIVWLDLSNFDWTVTFKMGDRQINASLSLPMTVKVKEGDLLKEPLESELGLRTRIKQGLEKAITDSFVDKKFDPIIFRALVNDRFSTEVIGVEVGSKGITLSETQTFINDYPITAPVTTVENQEDKK